MCVWLNGGGGGGVASNSSQLTALAQWLRVQKVNMQWRDKGVVRYVTVIVTYRDCDVI